MEKGVFLYIMKFHNALQLVVAMFWGLEQVYSSCQICPPGTLVQPEETACIGGEDSCYTCEFLSDYYLGIDPTEQGETCEQYQNFFIFSTNCCAMDPDAEVELPGM